MGRSIVGVVAGFLYVIAGSMLSEFTLGMLTLPESEDEPIPPFMWLARVATIGFFAVVGGYVAAVLSRRAERLHALILAVILAGVLAFTAIQVLKHENPPDWFKLTLPAIGFLCATLGGECRARYVAWVSQRTSSRR